MNGTIFSRWTDDRKLTDDRLAALRTRLGLTRIGVHVDFNGIFILGADNKLTRFLDERTAENHLRALAS